jgi:hypothetical protein
MYLNELAGKHTLDAVDFSTEKVTEDGGADYFIDSQVCRFRLNGTVYVAREDPSDGYRSSMRELRTDDAARMYNVFPAIEVVGRHREFGQYGHQDDILELIDATTGKVVLEVGTACVDDYYPSFVSSFHPENMATNAESPTHDR